MAGIFDLHGKIALITGGSSGMGKEIARQLGLHGAQVIILSNDDQGNADTLSDFTKQDIQAIAYHLDITDKENLALCVNSIINQFSKIDILVSCVGISRPGSFMDISAENFEYALNVNLKSAMELTQFVLPKMIDQKEGALIYLASIAGLRGNTFIGMYGITKAALSQMVRNLAVEFGPNNIRANAISPGLIDTPFAQSLIQNKEFMEKRLQLTPLRRVGIPAEIAGMAVLLASKAGAFITGQNIVIDGGTMISDGG